MNPADQLAQGLATLVVFIAIMAVIGITAIIFWIVMLIDCATKETTDKTMWMIVIIFTHALGATIYFFVRVVPRKNQGQKRPAVPPPLPPPLPIDDRRFIPPAVR